MSRNSGTQIGEVLLAKPPKGKQKGRTIVEHTQDVVTAFETLFCQAEQPELLESWVRFFRLGGKEPFLRNGWIAAACHDWGKANDGFQQMLLHRETQLLRHEQISAILMHHSDVWDWLSRGKKLDLPMILAAVVGHHLKARGPEFGRPQADIDTLLRTRWENRELQDYLAKLAPDVPDVPKLWSYTPRAGAADLLDALDGVRDCLEQLGDELEKDEARKRLLWAVRAALIVADSAGSGLFREGKGVQGWISGVFDPKRRLDADAIRKKVIGPRLEQMGNRWKDWNGFQDACGNTGEVPERSLLLAPCGSGKTLAAWRWIEARCADERKVGRVVFLYPTRGTATEGYRDYVSHAGPAEAALVHGTADLEIDDIHPDLNIEDRIKEARLFALQQWPKKLFSATADQFLGFLQHGYGPTCLLPLLTDSVLVFDEVHSYDRGMFSALLDFLRHFDVPVLCMTATLLEARQKQLEKGDNQPDALMKEHGLKIVNGLDFDDDGGLLQDIAGHKRYQIRTVADTAEAKKAVEDALRNNMRVLWVVNTVDRAQDIARDLAARTDGRGLKTSQGVRLFCYHSRFKLSDRKRWHNRVIKAFRKPSKKRPKRPILAVTTQVCEMSLDLDADLLVTEHAPASSLVQRMGRCCRDMQAHRTNRVGEVILYPPESQAPYTKQDMLGAPEFVNRLVETGLVSQSQLEEFMACVPQAAELPKECRFIESGPWAASGEENFRDIDDLNRQALLPEDEQVYLHLRRENKHSWEWKNLVLSVPKKFIDPKPRKDPPAWLRLTKGGCYLPTLGYGERDKPSGPTIV